MHGLATKSDKKEQKGCHTKLKQMKKRKVWQPKKAKKQERVTTPTNLVSATAPLSKNKLL